MVELIVRTGVWRNNNKPRVMICGIYYVIAYKDGGSRDGNVETCGMVRNGWFDDECKKKLLMMKRTLKLIFAINAT